MNRRFIPGAQFVDALPTGEYAATLPNQPVQTHLGPVALPAAEAWGLHYIQVSNVGGFHFGGQAHTRPAGAPPLFWEWRNGQWSSRIVPTGRGAYDQAGTFRDAAPAGYQFVDDTGAPISRVDTYNDPAHGLSEWCEIAGLRIGQGNGTPDGGVLVWDSTHKRVLVDPPTFAIFLTAHHVGEKATVCYVAKDGAWIIDTTLSELRALPIWTAPVPSPPVQPPSKEPPVAVTVPNESAFVKSSLTPRLKKLDTPQATVENSFAALNDCALALHARDAHWGLLEKTGGNRVQDRATDILAYDLGDGTCQLVDVIGDADGADGAPHASWGLVAEKDAGIRKIAQWKAPYPASAPQQPPVDPPAPPPVQPQTPPPAVDLSAINAAIADLKAQVAAGAARISALEARPVGAKAGDAVEVTGSISLSNAIYGREVTWGGVIK